MMTPGCPLMFLNFSLWGVFLPSPMLIHLSPSMLELQRICAICVFKIDFLIFFFYIYTQLFVIQCSLQHLRLNGPCNVQLQPDVTLLLSKCFRQKLREAGLGLLITRLLALIYPLELHKFCLAILFHDQQAEQCLRSPSPVAVLTLYISSTPTLIRKVLVRLIQTAGSQLSDLHA